MPDSSNTSTAIDLLSKASEVVSEEITSETKEIAPYTRYSDLKMCYFFQNHKFSNPDYYGVLIVLLLWTFG